MRQQVTCDQLRLLWRHNHALLSTEPVPSIRSRRIGLFSRWRKTGAISRQDHWFRSRTRWHTCNRFVENAGQSLADGSCLLLCSLSPPSEAPVCESSHAPCHARASTADAINAFVTNHCLVCEITFETMRSVLGLFPVTMKQFWFGIKCTIFLNSHSPEDISAGIARTSLFFHWNISIICPIIVLKLVATVFTSLYFRTLRPKTLNFFRPFKKIGLWLKND